MEELFKKLYGHDEKVIEGQRRRYLEIKESFEEFFPENEREIYFFSTSGRTEVSGNHTDHNHGKVLAAGVNLDSVAAASKTNDSRIKVYSRGYEGVFEVDLENLNVVEKEKGTTTALIRGIASRFNDLGYNIGGFNAYISSDVLGGSGLSSSASIEVLLGTILNHLYNHGKMDEKLLAIIGQYAENVFFGKPCGLMDQMACAVGGFVTIDFEKPDNPEVKKIDFDFESQGYSLLVVDTGGNHADLTEDYASIPREMKAVAKALGHEVSRDLNMEEVIQNIPKLRNEVNDRAILRVMHFLHENHRVKEQEAALEKGDFDGFLEMVTQSGNSSWKWLQNCFTNHSPLEQGITLALALTEDFIKKTGKGACRVHGGGFAGTIQAFLPKGYVRAYKEEMESVFGQGSVTVLNIRPLGTTKVDIKL